MTFITPFILFFLSGFASILTNNKRVLNAIFCLTSLVALLFSIYFAINIKTQVGYVFGGFSVDLGIEYTANPFKLSLVSFLCGLFFIFSIFFNGFIRHFNEDFEFNTLFCILQIMCGSAIAIIFTNDLFNFYIFLELLAICCYVLTSLGKGGGSYASFNYLFLGIIASGFLVLGIGMLYFSTGYLNFTKVAELLHQNTEVKAMIPFAFILTGFLIKLAVFPFSFWAGLVYKYFPNSVLPLYGSLVSFVTFYGLFTFKNTFFVGEAEAIKMLILALSSIGVLVFSFFSLFENNVKKIFAYSTIGQVSYSIFILFFSDKTLNALAFLHLASNSLSKLALFIICFEVFKTKQNTVISAFENLSEKSKFLSIVVLFFFANIIGLPLMFGFFTKLSIILSVIPSKQYIFVALILIGAILNFLYFWRIASVIFYPKYKEEGENLTVSIESKISLFILVAVCVVAIFLFSTILNFLSLSI